MIISGVSRYSLESALAVANKRFGGNIVWNRAPEALSRDGSRFRLTLRCKSSRGLGHRVSPGGRRLVSACWHVHGHFFDALPTRARIVTAGMTTHPGEPWQDFNVGSFGEPCLASTACDCSEVGADE